MVRGVISDKNLSGFGKLKNYFDQFKGENESPKLFERTFREFPK